MNRPTAPYRHTHRAKSRTAAGDLARLGRVAMRLFGRPAMVPVFLLATVAVLGGGQPADPTPASMEVPAHLEDRTADVPSRSATRTNLPVTVPDDAVWEMQGHAELMAWVAQVEAEREAARLAAEAEAARLAAEDEAARVAAEAEAARVAAARPAAGPAPDTGTVKAYASDLVGGGDQFACLDALWQKESGWNHLADNPSSGAYGIPQALPGSKMASAGEDWETNPLTQVSWGVSYITGRYGTPCAAWDHSVAKNWY